MKPLRSSLFRIGFESQTIRISFIPEVISSVDSEP